MIPPIEITIENISQGSGPRLLCRLESTDTNVKIFPENWVSITKGLILPSASTSFRSLFEGMYFIAPSGHTFTATAVCKTGKEGGAVEEEYMRSDYIEMYTRKCDLVREVSIISELTQLPLCEYAKRGTYLPPRTPGSTITSTVECPKHAFCGGGNFLIQKQGYWAANLYEMTTERWGSRKAQQVKANQSEVPKLLFEVYSKNLYEANKDRMIAGITTSKVVHGLWKPTVLSQRQTFRKCEANKCLGNQPLKGGGYIAAVLDESVYTARSCLERNNIPIPENEEDLREQVVQFLGDPTRRLNDISCACLPCPSEGLRMKKKAPKSCLGFPFLCNNCGSVAYEEQLNKLRLYENLYSPPTCPLSRKKAKEASFVNGYYFVSNSNSKLLCEKEKNLNGWSPAESAPCIDPKSVDLLSICSAQRCQLAKIHPNAEREKNDDCSKKNYTPRDLTLAWHGQSSVKREQPIGGPRFSHCLIPLVFQAENEIGESSATPSADFCASLLQKDLHNEACVSFYRSRESVPVLEIANYRVRCTHGSFGNLCASCVKGYVHVNGRCLPCPKSLFGLLPTFLYLCLQFIGLFFILAAVAISAKIKDERIEAVTNVEDVKKEVKNRKRKMVSLTAFQVFVRDNCFHSRAEIVEYFRGIARLAYPNLQGGDQESLLTIFKIVLTFSQIQSIIFRLMKRNDEIIFDRPEDVWFNGECVADALLDENSSLALFTIGLYLFLPFNIIALFWILLYQYYVKELGKDLIIDEIKMKEAAIEAENFHEREKKRQDLARIKKIEAETKQLELDGHLWASKSRQRNCGVNSILKQETSQMMVRELGKNYRSALKRMKTEEGEGLLPTELLVYLREKYGFSDGDVFETVLLNMMQLGGGRIPMIILSMKNARKNLRRREMEIENDVPIQKWTQYEIQDFVGDEVFSKMDDIALVDGYALHLRMQQYFFNLLGVLVLVMYPTLSRSVLGIFSCASIDVHRQDGSEQWLVADLNYECYTEQHTQWLVIGSLIGVILVCVPGILFHLLQNVEGKKYTLIFRVGLKNQKLYHSVIQLIELAGLEIAASAFAGESAGLIARQLLVTGFLLFCTLLSARERSYQKQVHNMDDLLSMLSCLCSSFVLLSASLWSKFLLPVKNDASETINPILSPKNDGRSIDVA
eukprot:g5139.t1